MFLPSDLMFLLQMRAATSQRVFVFPPVSSLHRRGNAGMPGPPSMAKTMAQLEAFFAMKRSCGECVKRSLELLQRKVCIKIGRQLIG